MRQPHASGGRWRSGALPVDGWDGARTRMVLIGLDAITWIYVMVVARQALFG
jgi:hypothetical protein